MADRPLRTLADCAALAAGCAAVVLALIVGHGASVLARNPVDGLARDVVVVSGQAPSADGIQSGTAYPSLTPDDATALGNTGYLPDVTAAAPASALHAAVTVGGRSATGDVLGTSPSFSGVLGYSVADGRMLDPADGASASPVAVLGQTMVNTLFDGQDPVGRTVTIDGKDLQVVGTFAARGYSGTFDRDDVAVVPLQTLWKVLAPSSGTPIDQVLLRTAKPGQAKATARAATALLLQRHAIIDPALADFTVTTQADLIGPQLQVSHDARRLLELMAGLLLAAGAIQLATLQRHREAPFDTWDRDGGWLLLASTTLLGVIAGVIGVAVGVASVALLRHLVIDLPPLHAAVVPVVTGFGLTILAAEISLLPATFRPRRTELRRPPTEDPS
jgi:putative ABC transport system permease protein